MTQWLTPDEVYALTEKRRWTAQCRVLAARSIRFIRAGAKSDGRPLVNRTAVDEKGQAAAAEDRRWARLLERQARRDAWRAKSFQHVPLPVIVASRKPYELGKGPNVSGIYFLFDGTQLAYVGQSGIISTRLFQHRKNFAKFDSFAYVACPSALLDEVEQRYILEAQPRDNVAYNGALR